MQLKISRRSRIGTASLTTLILAVLGLAALLASADAARADTLIYANQPPSYASSDTGVIPQGGQAVTDSFTVSANADLTTAALALWSYASDLPQSVDWSIGTSAFGSDVSSGTGATLSNVFEFTNSDSYNVYQAAFTLNGALSAGTYWLTISNATGSTGGTVQWDQNFGPSSAYEGSVSLNESIGSEWFQLYGNPPVPVAAPLPASWSLGVLGLALLALVQWASRRWFPRRA